MPQHRPIDGVKASPPNENAVAPDRGDAAQRPRHPRTTARTRAAKMSGARSAGAERPLKAARPAKAPKVRIRMALVSDLGAQIAVIVRKPKDDGLPLLLLNSSIARAVDVRAAARMAATTVERFGEHPTKRHRLVLRRSGSLTDGEATAVTEHWAPMLAALEGRSVRQLDGVGQVRYVDLLVAPPAARPSAPTA